MIQVEQQPIDTKIGQQIILSMPEGWSEAVLTAERMSVAPGSESYRISVTSTTGAAGIAFVDAELQDAVRQLYLLHRRHGTGLRIARYTVTYEDGEWRMASEFEYDD